MQGKRVEIWIAMGALLLMGGYMINSKGSGSFNGLGKEHSLTLGLKSEKGSKQAIIELETLADSTESIKSVPQLINMDRKDSDETPQLSAPRRRHDKAGFEHRNQQIFDFLLRKGISPLGGGSGAFSDSDFDKNRLNRYYLNQLSKRQDTDVLIGLARRLNIRSSAVAQLRVLEKQGEQHRTSQAKPANFDYRFQRELSRSRDSLGSSRHVSSQSHGADRKLEKINEVNERQKAQSMAARQQRVKDTKNMRMEHQRREYVQRLNREIAKALTDLHISEREESIN